MDYASSVSSKQIWCDLVKIPERIQVTSHVEASEALRELELHLAILLCGRGNDEPNSKVLIFLTNLL